MIGSNSLVALIDVGFQSNWDLIPVSAQVYVGLQSKWVSQIKWVLLPDLFIFCVAITCIKFRKFIKLCCVCMSPGLLRSMVHML